MAVGLLHPGKEIQKDIVSSITTLKMVVSGLSKRNITRLNSVTAKRAKSRNIATVKISKLIPVI
jgi:hypothetical protein